MKKYILIALFAGSLLNTSCKKYLDINNDPNRPTEAPINGLLAATTQNTGLKFFVQPMRVLIIMFNILLPPTYLAQQIFMIA